MEITTSCGDARKTAQHATFAFEFFEQVLKCESNYSGILHLFYIHWHCLEGKMKSYSRHILKNFSVILSKP